MCSPCNSAIRCQPCTGFRANQQRASSVICTSRVFFTMQYLTIIFRQKPLVSPILSLPGLRIPFSMKIERKITCSTVLVSQPPRGGIPIVEWRFLKIALRYLPAEGQVPRIGQRDRNRVVLSWRRTIFPASGDAPSCLGAMRVLMDHFQVMYEHRICTQLATIVYLQRQKLHETSECRLLSCHLGGPKVGEDKGMKFDALSFACLAYLQKLLLPFGRV